MEEDWIASEGPINHVESRGESPPTPCQNQTRVSFLKGLLDHHKEALIGTKYLPNPATIPKAGKIADMK
jgi:hypothetical protein